MTTALLGVLSCHSSSPSWRHMKARLTELQALQLPPRLAQTKSSGSWLWVCPRVMINSSPTYMCVIQHDSLIGCFNTLSNRRPFCIALWILCLIVGKEWHLSFFSFNRRSLELGGDWREKSVLSICFYSQVRLVNRPVCFANSSSGVFWTLIQLLLLRSISRAQSSES